MFFSRCYALFFERWKIFYRKAYFYLVYITLFCRFVSYKNKETMTDLNTSTRAELEVAILEHDLEDALFGGLDAIMKLETEEIREKLINWVVEGNEATC